MRLPFSKRLSSKNAADIDIARAARDKIAARLAAAERAVAEHHANVRQLALTDADDAALEAAESAMRMAQDRVRTLSDGLHEADESIRQAEQRRDAADDLKRRAETAAVIDDVAERLGEVGSEFAGLMQKMAALTERAVALTPDASGLHGFCGRALIEIPESAELLSQVLRDIANATRNGSAPASLPRPEREAQPTRHVPPATTRVFTTRPIKWLDADGDLRIQPEFFDIDLPPDIAARANSTLLFRSITRAAARCWVMAGSIELTRPGASASSKATRRNLSLDRSWCRASHLSRCRWKPARGITSTLSEFDP